MTIKNRDKFLDNLAEQLGRPRITEGVERPTWSLSPQWDVFKGYSLDELVDVLEIQCEKLLIGFNKTSSAELERTLKEVIDSHEGKSVLAANDPRNEEFNLLSIYGNYENAGLEVNLWDPAKKKENQVLAERADIGITFSDVTLAESGTVTLFNDKNNGRSISLLPKVHIAIIPKSTIVPRMTQATKQIHDAHMAGQEVSSAVSFISGPSKSADIEMINIVGVHGPIHVNYIVVEDK